MAKIIVNEISANYTYNIGTSSYATVALPITSCWGPGYFDPEAEYGSLTNETIEKMLEHTVWQRFPATQAGLDSFISTYRGASDVYRVAKDNSYQMAMTLLTAGYDVLTCRICPGNKASGSFSTYEPDTETDTDSDTDTEVNPADYLVSIRAKYPGTFGNNIQIAVRKLYYRKGSATVPYWNFITYVVDANGVRSSVENISFVFELAHSTDSILYYEEIESNFFDVTVGSLVTDDASAPTDVVTLSGGTDYVSNKITQAKTDTAKPLSDTYQTAYAAWVAAGKPTSGATKTALDNARTALDNSDVVKAFKAVAKDRFDWAKRYQGAQSDIYEYYYGSIGELAASKNNTMQNVLYYQEWIRTHLVGLNKTASDGTYLGGVFDLLKDKLSYNPNRVISPGWDDQDLFMYTDDQADIDDITDQEGNATCAVKPSPLHLKIMDVAYYSRCATGFVDVPKIVERKYVHIESANPDIEGYIQELARLVPTESALETNAPLYSTHCGFFAPWGQYTYVGTSKMSEASPSFLALLIQRAQILNQSIQYEWALPTNRKHNLRIGKMEYTVPKKVLDQWQKLEGASVNVITTIPDLGTNIWGNSTMFEVPPATYQALANLSTRFLVNAVEDVVYRCGIAITFQYNNSQSYSAFYAGVTPILDTMCNVGAIERYEITMSADINGEDYVNANSVIGVVKIWCFGIINNISVDLVALPAGISVG